MGGLFACFVIAGGIFVILTPDNADKSPTPYALHLPKSLDKGKYRLKTPHEDNGPGAFDTTNTGGTYTCDDGEVVYTGTFSTFDDPAEQRESMSREFHRDAGLTFPVPKMEYTSNGATQQMSCGVAVGAKGSAKGVTVPYCLWADHYTMGSFSRVDFDATRTVPESINMDDFADWAGRVRDEVRVPAK